MCGSLSLVLYLHTPLFERGRPSYTFSFPEPHPNLCIILDMIHNSCFSVRCPSLLTLLLFFVLTICVGRLWFFSHTQPFFLSLSPNRCLSPLQTKLNVNTYTAKKTLSQGMLDIALLSAIASQLKYILQVRKQKHYSRFNFVILRLVTSMSSTW